ncbi:GDSL-like Lipase/Acylhydrolase [Zalerion maritima]|uniref:GDSL-like Lipase/Acylhydrolase n=1 Tax=Zalerion maritima TaxID=339359 RepID=A0AAD5RJV9_9PEZI|nr:GDSL-like Lipase/Acylhydrolase [Zalerion maritima]
MLNLRAVITTALLFAGQTSSWPAKKGKNWVDIWGTMPQLTELHNLPPEPFTTNEGVLQDATVRSTMYVTLSASTIRLQISNVFGGTDLPVTEVTLAKPANGSAGVRSVQASTITPVTFSGWKDFIVPSGSAVLSDPLDMSVDAGTNLAVSMYLAEGQMGNAITSHPGSRTDSYFASGNLVNEASFPANATSAAHWFFISALEGWADEHASAVVVVGDSISDGRGSTTNGNDRWPDQLLGRMRERWSTRDIAVINEAAGGNRLLLDGLGPNALGRIDRDVIAQSGVKYAIVLEGVNDFGAADPDQETQEEIAQRLISAYDQMIARLHRFGIAVFGGTITPCSGPGQSYGEGYRENTRQTLNEWIRNSGRFDGVVDFDKMVRNPANETMLLGEYDDGDYLHLNPLGYQKMAEAVDLSLFWRFEDGPESEFT